MLNPEHKISLLLPTRGRVFLLKRLFQSIVENSAHLGNIEIVLCLDEDDQESIHFEDGRLDIKKIIGKKSSMGTYNTKCLEGSTGNIIILLNDDLLICTNQWDKKIIDLYENVPDHIFMAYPDDMEKANLSTFPIMSRKTCDILIDPYPKEYIDLFIDDHIFDIFLRLKKLNHKRIFSMKDIVFDHRHFVNNDIRQDVSYAHKKRYKDYLTYIFLKDIRQAAANRLCAAIEKKPLPQLPKFTIPDKMPKNLFEAIFHYASSFLTDTGLPMKTRIYWFIRFSKYYAAMKSGIKFLKSKTYTLYGSDG